jgi:tetratricopeptide (TPR) repeat protein
MGEYELSLKDYDKIIELNATHSAIALYALGRLEETVTAFQDTITLLQDRVEGATSDEEVVLFTAYLSLAYNNRGSALQETGQVKRAIEDYTAAIQLNPQLGEAFYNRAIAFAVLGKIIEAKQDLDQAETLGFDGPN